jgi:hypothetical protein
VFNYKTEFNDVWDDADLRDEYRYQAIFGDGEGPVVVRLL